KKIKSLKNFIADREQRPAASVSDSPLRGSWLRRTAGNLSRKIANTCTVRAFQFDFRSANRCSFRLKRRHETGRANHRRRSSNSPASPSRARKSKLSSARRGNRTARFG